MPHLIACLGHERSEWADVNKIVNSGIFDSIFILSDSEGRSNYKYSDRGDMSISFITIKFSDPLNVMHDQIIASLKRMLAQGSIAELDIAVNISSGNGRMHAALISALLKLGYGIRLVGLDADGDVAEL